MYTVDETIKMLKEEIAEKENLISLVNDFKNGKIEFTEENYHQLCETSLRGGRILGEKLEEIFPFLKLIDKKSFINDYIFTLNINGENFTVKIPNSRRNNITIIIPKIAVDYTIDGENAQKEIDKINKAINEKSITKRADFIFPNYKKPFRLLAYLTNYRKKTYIERLTEIKNKLEKTQRFYEKKIKENDEITKRYNDVMEYFKNNYLTPMLKWTNQVVIAPYEGTTSYTNSIIFNK